MKTDTLTESKANYSLIKCLQFTNRTELIYNNDGHGKCAVIEHYYASEHEREKLENDILRSLNNYDSLLNALKEVSDMWRGVNDLYLHPGQKAALKKVNDTLIKIQAE